MDYTSCEFLSGSRTNSGIVKLTYLPPGSNQAQADRFTDTRGAFSWATENSPFYSVIIGMPHIDKFTEIKEPYYVLLHEWTDENFDLEQRYNRLADDSSLFCCNWLCDFSQKFEGDRESYYDFRSRHPGRDYGDIAPGPYADRFRLGVELLKTMTSRNKLELPKTSVLYQQLTRFSADNLKMKKVSQDFYAINAARFVLGSFKQDPPILQEYTGRRRDTTGETGWMAG